MNYKFLTYTEIEKFFQSNNINYISKDDQEIFFVCSVSDILYISEQFKKNNIKSNINTLNKNLEILIERDNIYFPEIDRDNLLDNLFEISNNNITLWEKACNTKISPRFSTSLIAIKINEASFWSEEVFEEMEQFYKNFE